MARSFSNAKLFSAFVADQVSVSLSRRGYAAAAASQGVVSSSSSTGGGRASVMVKKVGEESTKTSWVPDPVTGYYRPENQGAQIDVAELREMLLKQKINRH